MMSYMKTASVREVQHNLAAVLDMVSRGQEIAVTKRGRVIARIVPGEWKSWTAIRRITRGCLDSDLARWARE